MNECQSPFCRCINKTFFSMGLILQDSDTNDASTNTDKDLLMSDDELTSVHGNGDLTVAYKSLKMTNQ